MAFVIVKYVLLVKNSKILTFPTLVLDEAKINKVIDIFGSYVKIFKIIKKMIEKKNNACKRKLLNG